MALVRFIRFHDTYAGYIQHDPTTDELALAGLQMSGDITMSSNEVTGLPSTPSATGAASKEYVDNLISGLVWRNPAIVLQMVDDASSGPPTLGSGDAGKAYVVDSATGAWSGFSVGDIVEWDGSAWNLILAQSGGEPPDGTRVIVAPSPGAGGSFNGHGDEIGVYDATGDSWSFISPSDGDAVLINGENGYWENTAWVYDSTPGGWIQFSGAGQISDGAGLLKSGNVLDVRFGNGIAQNPSDYVGIDLATTSGLELTGSSPDQQLRVLTDGAHGIVLSASGVEIEIDDIPDTLDVDADGLKVVGLPSLFKVNDTAVGATVTAANLDDLTDGSNADSLHVHTHTGVTDAARVEETILNNASVSAGQVVRWSSTNNEITPAANDSFPNARAIGVARTGGAANPGTSNVVRLGKCAGVLSGATVNTPYFLSSTGTLVVYGSLSLPCKVVRMGFAANATDLDVQITDFGWQLV
jgi:hypothetical protein